MLQGQGLQLHRMVRISLYRDVEDNLSDLLIFTELESVHIPQTGDLQVTSLSHWSQIPLAHVSSSFPIEVKEFAIEMLFALVANSCLIWNALSGM